MKKKALGYLLCAAMVFSMAACGDDPGEQESSQPDSVEESSEPSSEEQPSEEESSEEEPSDEEEAEEPEEVTAGPAAIRVEAESYEQGEGVSVEDDHLGGLNTKAWAMYNVDLADGGYKQVSIRYGADSIGGTVKLWIGDEDYAEFGSMIGEAVFEGTGSWDMDHMVTFDVPDLAGQSGATDLVIEWESPEGESDYLMNPDWIEFYKVAGAGAKTASFNFFDNDFSGNEWAGYRGPEGGDYTHIYLGGGCYTGYKVDFGEEGGYNELCLIGDFIGDCSLELHLDSPDGQLVGSVDFTGGADWNDSIIQTNSQTVSVPDLASVTGAHGIYFVINGGDYNWAAFRFFNKPATKLSERVEAEDVIENGAWIGTDVDPAVASGGGEVGGTTPDTYVVYRLDFEDGGYNKVLMRYGTITAGGDIEVRYGDPNGELITTIVLKAEDAPETKAEDFGSNWEGWADFELEVPELADITGEQIICFVFQPGDNGWVGNFDYYEFSK